MEQTFDLIGSSTCTVVPPPGILWAEIFPPCASTVRLQMANPNPIPLALVVKRGVQSLLRVPSVIPWPLSLKVNTIVSSVFSAVMKSLPPLGMASSAFWTMLRKPRLTTIEHVTTIKGTSSTPTSTIITTSTVPVGWPVKTVYPDGGALLPFNRIVAYYGNLYSTQMGVLGEYPETEMLQMLASTTAEWQAADPTTHVIPALDDIAVAAQGNPGADGNYRARMPAAQINKVIQMAAQINGIVFLDVQVGLSNVQTEIPLLAPYLKLPQVNLAIDPEFAMHNGEKPGTVIGTLDAADINYAANYLANVVRENNLPPKILVIHRFTQAMVTNCKNITPLREVQIVMDMDGFGPPAQR